MKIEDYWQEFLVKNSLPKETRYIEAFKFGYTDKQADDLLLLVLEGKKKATTSPYFEEDTYCKVGDYSIILDSANEPRCVIKTTKSSFMRFNDMTFEVCKLEGEDECIETWIENHVAFLKEACDEHNCLFSFDMPIIFEQFEVIYK